MTEFYRFRSIEKLLGPGFRELERQTIFFASPEELNDPMEGFRDLVWDGDHIVWSNLFKNYVHCLRWTLINALIFGNEYNLEPGHIPIRMRWDTEPTPAAVELFEAVWEKVRGECELEALARGIAELEYSGTKHRVRRTELLFYLQSVHIRALAAIQQVLVDRGLMLESQQIAVNSRREREFTTQGYFEAIKRASENPMPMSEYLFSLSESMFRNIAIRHKFAPEEPGRRNLRHLVVDFPAVYVDQLRKLLWPEWYTACFVKECHNSSLWSTYGDAHKGACLIFGVDAEGGQAHLQLKQVTGWSSSGEGDYRESWGFRPQTFHAVRYQDKPDEVDFFQSMGQPTEDALFKLWYTDGDGNLSNRAAQLFGPGRDKGAWRDRYWSNFIRDACFKTKDWEYEQEYRLILYPLLESAMCARQRTLTYGFNSLKGIVFGIRTSDEDKLKIIDIIMDKCRETQRTDFQFLQAYYSPETGDIRSHNIPLGPISQ